MAAFARVVLGLVVCGLLCGCVDLGKVEAFRSDVSRLKQSWAGEAAALERRLSSMPADDPMRPDAEAALARAKAKEAAAEAAVRQVDLVVTRARHPDDPLGQSVGALSPLLPEPVRWPLALGAALVASVVRARQLKDGMASIATGLDRAMADDPEFAAKFRQHANTFRSIQTRTARRVIDQTQRARKKAA
jgi:hypothetical protein